MWCPPSLRCNRPPLQVLSLLRIRVLPLFTGNGKEKPVRLQQGFLLTGPSSFRNGRAAGRKPTDRREGF